MSAENQKQQTAIEMAVSIGDEAVELDAFWANVNDFNFPDLLRDLGSNLGLTGGEWNSFLANAGFGLLGFFETQLNTAKLAWQEQATAERNRAKFGMPEIELALPIYAKLAAMEARAREALQHHAEQAEVIWDEINQQLVYAVELFLASRINVLEDDALAHEAALKQSKEYTAEEEGLENVDMQVETKMDAKQLTITEEVEKLVQAFKLFRNKVAEKGMKLQGTIFEASGQSLAISSI